MSTALTQRALRPDDAAAISVIYAAIESAEQVDEVLSERDIAEEMTSPGAELDRASVGVFDDDRLVAFGWLSVSPPAIDWKAFQWAGVLPEYTRRGLGHRIIRELEAAAARIRDDDAPGRRGESRVWVVEKRPSAGALVDAAGYQTWRHFFHMRADLLRPAPPIPAPVGVEIRPYRASDDDDVLRVSNESFADHWGSVPMDLERWRAQFADSSSFRPGVSRVALLDGAIVSFVLCSEVEADTQRRGYGTGYLARVGTLRSARGRGIAGALLGAIEGLAAAEYRYAELTVDTESPTGAGRLYERAGFGTVGRSRVVGRRF